MALVQFIKHWPQVNLWQQLITWTNFRHLWTIIGASDQEDDFVMLKRDMTKTIQLCYLRRIQWWENLRKKIPIAKKQSMFTVFKYLRAKLLDYWTSATYKNVNSKRVKCRKQQVGNFNFLWQTCLRNDWKKKSSLLPILEKHILTNRS